MIVKMKKFAVLIGIAIIAFALAFVIRNNKSETFVEPNETIKIEVEYNANNTIENKKDYEETEPTVIEETESVEETKPKQDEVKPVEETKPKQEENKEETEKKTEEKKTETKKKTENSKKKEETKKTETKKKEENKKTETKKKTESKKKEENKKNDSNLVSLGKFKLTAYCACSKCCGKSDGITATGTKAKQGRTIAVDPKKIPYGTKVSINGNTYIAEDCGGSIKDNRIDIFFDSHKAALNFGVQYATVYIVKG